ncbi:hypothetical protein KW805_01810 [Candidatus Pacearchaeota archaeon]|nr:hypothetical protein [Candidatus Pacearchaeota archaeon]
MWISQPWIIGGIGGALVALVLVLTINMNIKWPFVGGIVVPYWFTASAVAKLLGGHYNILSGWTLPEVYGKITPLIEKCGQVIAGTLVLAIYVSIGTAVGWIVGLFLRK